MSVATSAIDSTTTEASWRITREGMTISQVGIIQEHGAFVVSAGGRPYRFDSMQAADAFITDLLASFSYLGCDVTQDRG
jgi:hypothetical protein